MASEEKQPRKQLSADERKQRFENRQSAKKSTVENNPDAIVIVPKSPVTRMLINAIMTFDTVDALMRAQAGLNIDFDEFGNHVKAFKEISTTLDSKNQEVLGLIAKNEKINSYSIQNRYVRGEIETMRKNLKKETAAPTPATSKTVVDQKKEGEPEAKK